jgi:hypothetical protein
MELNLPILDKLADSTNILIAGAGGGFDIFVGLPIYFTLKALGKTVHLANYSFSEMALVKHVSEPIVLIEDDLIGAHGMVNRVLPYYPEGYLAQWFKETHHEDITIWMFSRPGVVQLIESYNKLIEHLGRIDALILVDGGVDSIMRGNEDNPATMLEDSITLCAINSLDIPVKILGCLGFGTEMIDGMCHYHALENIAALAKEGPFLGSCALTPQMQAFQLYEAALRYVWDQPFHQKSHISTQVIPAVHGEMGNYHLYDDDFAQRVRVSLSPLMSLYWFFDAMTVYRHNLIAPALSQTSSVREALGIASTLRHNFQIRPRKNIPY